MILWLKFTLWLKAKWRSDPFSSSPRPPLARCSTTMVNKPTTSSCTYDVFSSLTISRKWCRNILDLWKASLIPMIFPWTSLVKPFNNTNFSKSSARNWWERFWICSRRSQRKTTSRNSGRNTAPSTWNSLPSVFALGHHLLTNKLSNFSSFV